MDDTRRFRRQVAGLAMIGAPLVIVVAEVLHARFETEPAKQLAAVAENTDRWYAAHVLVLVALGLAVPAFLGLVHLVCRRRPVLANLAQTLFVPGVVAVAAVAGMELVLWQMAQPGRDRAEMVALAERVNESAGLAPVFLAAVVLYPLAWMLAGIGLYLTRVATPWAAGLIAAAQPIGFAAELVGAPKAVAVAAQIAFALGLVPIGISVLRRTDGEWEEAGTTGLTPAAAGG